MTWLVLGAGRSGIAAAKLLSMRGQDVVLADRGNIPSHVYKNLKDLGIQVKESDPGDAFNPSITSGIVLSPGVSQKHPYIQRAKKLGIPSISEVDLALSSFKGKTIGITGTNGKSTTVSMAYHLLESMGYRVALAGNIGIPPSEIICCDHPLPEIMVLELSSYQLEQSKKVRSNVAAILNISPDHLARHGTMDQYLREKWKIALMCPADSHVFIDSRVASLASKFEQPQCHMEIVDADLAIAKVDPNESGQHEWHNRLNGYYAATLVSQLVGLPFHRVIPHLASFKGLSHRFEKIGTIKGGVVINDSKATNVESTLVALSNLRKATILLLGGQGKGESFDEIRKYQGLIQNLVLFGHEAPKIAKELKEMKPIVYPSLRVTMNSLPEMMSVIENKPDLLFSPACASFDEFNNFEERGDFFKKEIKPLLDT